MERSESSAGWTLALKPTVAVVGVIGVTADLKKRAHTVSRL